MRIFSKEEMKIIYYILDKDIDDKYLTGEELNFVKDFDFSDKNLLDTAKTIWKYKDNPKMVNLFIKMIRDKGNTKNEQILYKFINKGDKSMNNKLMVFNNSEFGEIRSITIDDEPYFIGNEIATILGYKNGSRDINRHVDEEDRAVVPIRYFRSK